MTVLEDPRLVPGALQEELRRELPNGDTIVFERAPAGWLTKKGEPRQQAWRAYYYEHDGSRTRFNSVTTILDAIMPKGGLPPWAEARGIEGAITAVNQGDIQHGLDPREAVKIVRDLKLGADAARNSAADRGLNVHALLEDYMRTGTVPDLADHAPGHQGYVQALCSWLLKARLKPIAVEQLVCDPVAKYAGRRDLVALLPSGGRVGYDAKTQERAGIFSSAHIQLRMYERAGIACGDEPCDELRVVTFAANGEWREMPCKATDATVDAALAFANELRPIEARCESLNRAERKARQ